MHLATLLRYMDLKKNNIWDHRYYIMHDYQLMAEKYQVGLSAIMSPYDLDRLADQCDGLIVPGSGTNIDPSYYGKPPLESPEPVDEYALDSKAIDAFVRRGKPVFGVCGGHQALNVFFGGTLKQVEVEGSHSGKDHLIRIEKDSFVFDVFGGDSATVNSHHGWEIEKLAPGLKAVAWSEDGVIEAVEWKEKKIFATQWHPEQSFHTGDPKENEFFKNFIELCKK